MLSLFDCLDPYWPSWTAVTVFGQDPIGVYIIIYAFSACRLRRSGVLQKLSKRPLAKWHLVHVAWAMWCLALPICWHLFGVPSGRVESLAMALYCRQTLGFMFDLGYAPRIPESGSNSMHEPNSNKDEHWNAAQSSVLHQLHVEWILQPNPWAQSTTNKGLVGCIWNQESLVAWESCFWPS